MSLRPSSESCIPEETARVAHAAFPKGHPYLRMRDALGPVYSDPAFAPLFPKDGQPAEAPAHLALVTIMQFAEGLSDRQAADAVRDRLSWKYLLGLGLTDPGFDASILSEFRGRLIAGGAEALLFETLLTHLRAQGLVKPRGRQRTDSTHVLAAIHVLNRLECIGEALRYALNTLATVAPDWLRAWVPPSWADRYARRFEDYRLPDGKAARYALAAEIGADGCLLLSCIYAVDAPAWLRAVPAVQVLRRVWLQQFHAAAPDAPLCWRTAEDLPPGTAAHQLALRSGCALEQETRHRVGGLQGACDRDLRRGGAASGDERRDDAGDDGRQHDDNGHPGAVERTRPAATRACGRHGLCDLRSPRGQPPGRDRPARPGPG